MSRIARGLAAAAVLALGICCAASSPGRGAGDEEEARAVKEARQGILKLTKMNGGAAKTQAKAIADAARKAAGGADEGLKFVMRANKAKAKGGKAPEIKQAASYLNASCTNCHSTFRD